MEFCAQAKVCRNLNELEGLTLVIHPAIENVIETLFKNALIIHERNACLMSVFICDKDMLAVFDEFLPGFYGSHKVNLQNVYVKWTFEMVRFWSRTINSQFVFYQV